MICTQMEIRSEIQTQTIAEFIYHRLTLVTEVGEVVIKNNHAKSRRWKIQEGTILKQLLYIVQRF